MEIIIRPESPSEQGKIMMKNMILVVEVVIILLLITGCSFSDKFYDPSKNYNAIEGVISKDIWFTHKGTKIHTLLLLPEESISRQRVLILIPGKGGNVSEWYKFALPLVDAGYHVWLPDYPGHGLSEGKPSHKAVYEAINPVVGEMINHEIVRNKATAIWGFSLGANLAAKLAVNYQDSIKGLIIDGGCSSFEDVAVGTTEGGSFWVRLFVSSPYPAKNSIRFLTEGKTLIIHSEEDVVMPFEMGQLLYENAGNRKKFWPVTGEHCRTIHNETDNYIEKIEWIFA